MVALTLGTAITLGTTALSAGLAIKGQNQQEKANKKSQQQNALLVENSRKEAALRKKQREIQARRDRRKSLREYFFNRGEAANRLALSAGSPGNTSTNFAGSLSAQNLSNQGRITQAQEVSDQFFELDAEAGEITGKINQASSDFRTGQATSQLGADIFSNRKDIKAVGLSLFG